jgi:uncharacterized protein YbjT (DUF2867 family)
VTELLAQVGGSSVSLNCPCADQGGRHVDMVVGADHRGRAGIGVWRDAATGPLTALRHQGKAYALTGPEALSGDEVAERLSVATGNQVGSVDVSTDTFSQALVGAGLPGWLVERLIELNIMMADGHAAGSPTRWPG